MSLFAVKLINVNGIQYEGIDIALNTSNIVSHDKESNIIIYDRNNQRISLTTLENYETVSSSYNVEQISRYIEVGTKKINNVSFNKNINISTEGVYYVYPLDSFNIEIHYSYLGAVFILNVPIAFTEFMDNVNALTGITGGGGGSFNLPSYETYDEIVAADAAKPFDEEEIIFQRADQGNVFNRMLGTFYRAGFRLKKTGNTNVFGFSRPFKYIGARADYLFSADKEFDNIAEGSTDDEFYAGNSKTGVIQQTVESVTDNVLTRIRRHFVGTPATFNNNWVNRESLIYT